MNLFREGLIQRAASAATAAVMGLSLIVAPAIQAAAAAVESGKPRTLVVYAVEPNPDANAGSAIARAVTRAIVRGAGAASGASIIPFSEDNPSVQRALSESSIRPDEVRSAQESVAVASRLAGDLGGDHALLTTIDTYRYDASTRSVSLSVSAQLVDVSAKRSIKVVSVTGTAADSSLDQDALDRRAAADAASKLCAELFGVTPEQAVAQKSTGTASVAEKTEPVVKSKKANTGLWVLLAIGAIAAVAASSSGGGSDSGGGTLNPPPPPTP